MVTRAPTDFPTMSMDKESLQSSKGLVYIHVDVHSLCYGWYQSVTGDLEEGNYVNGHLNEGALEFMADHYGEQL
jgi:hypothetical protein